jgi:hypothetical protein
MQGYVYARQVRVKAEKRRLRRKMNRWHARVIIRHRRRKGIG